MFAHTKAVAMATKKPVSQREQMRVSVHTDIIALPVSKRTSRGTSSLVICKLTKVTSRTLRHAFPLNAFQQRIFALILDEMTPLQICDDDRHEVMGGGSPWEHNR